MTQEELDELLKKEFPIGMLSDEQFEKAKEIVNGPHKLDAVKYIYSIIPDEGLIEKGLALEAPEGMYKTE